MDVKTAFLYGDVAEDIYILQPEEFKASESCEQGLQAEKGAIWPKIITSPLV